MKISKLFLGLSFIFIVGCNTASNNKNIEFNNVDETLINTSKIILKDSLILNGNEGNWYYKNKLYSGFAVQYYSDGSLKDKTGFLNGKKEGIYKVWFQNGVLKLESNYHKNTLVGTYKVWWNNANLALESFYKKGKKEGVERQWYLDGSLSKERNLVKGRENGLQRAWLQNGKIYINYEAKNGRTFGLKRANLCYQLKNEKIAENKTN